jgi:transposase
MMPGVPERRTHSYVRHGTTSLFAALDVASGFVIGKCYKRHRAAEFLDFIKQVDAQVPKDLDVHIIMDNYATHKSSSDQGMAGAAAALSCAFHANIGILDQSGRTLVC